MTNADFEAVETLQNGLRVQIRAIRPSDKDALAAAFQRLAPESVYTRFFYAKKALSDQELRAATEVDFNVVVALVATVESATGEVIVGSGRYRVFDRPGRRCAEIAFFVEERYQGLGVARRFLKHLAAIAGAQGIDQFEAEVLPQNQAMLAVLRRSGLPIQESLIEDVIHVTLPLRDRPAQH